MVAGILAVVSMWYGYEEASELQLLNQAINTVSIIVQMGMLLFSIPVHALFRLFLVLFGISELVNAVFGEIHHYDHTYHLYKYGEELAVPFVILTFLSWSILEALTFIIEFHLSHLLSNKVNYRDQHVMQPLNPDEKVTYDTHHP